MAGAGPHRHGSSRRAAAARRDGRPRTPFPTAAPAVEVLLVGGDADAAAGLAAEIGSIAVSFGCPSVQARADHASAEVALATSEPAAALPVVRRERSVWERLGARYDIARCQMTG